MWMNACGLWRWWHCWAWQSYNYSTRTETSTYQIVSRTDYPKCICCVCDLLSFFFLVKLQFWIGPITRSHNLFLLAIFENCFYFAHQVQKFWLRNRFRTPRSLTCWPIEPPFLKLKTHYLYTVDVCINLWILLNVPKGLQNCLFWLRNAMCTLTPLFAYRLHSAHIDSAVCILTS